MVGVAGRSKACTTCKARHVRCDARHPTCGRCEKGGFQCQGYRRPLRFINSTGRSAKSNLLPQGGDSTRSSSRPQDMKGGADNHNVGNATLSRTTIDNLRSLDTPPSGLFPQSCLRIWPSNDIVFTTSYAHVAIATTAADDNISALIIGSRVWAQLHGDVAKHVQKFVYNLLIAQGMGLGVLESHQWIGGGMQPSALELSVEAAALALHGRLTKHTVNLQQAIMVYQLALRQLRTQLSSTDGNFMPSPTLNVSLLTVVMNMALFEWITNSASNAWKEHVRGLAAWVEKCGPEAFRQEDMRLAFERARAHIMLLHMEEARRTYLEDPCWQSIPWSENPSQKSFANRYIDIVCCIPGILEDEKLRVKMRQEYTSSDTTWPHDLYESLRQRVVLLYLKLLNLRWEWELQHPGCCFEVYQESRTERADELSADEATGQPIFNSVLFFTDFRRAVEINFYHSCLLILHDIAGDLGIMDELKEHQASRSCFSYKTNPPLTFPHEPEPDPKAVRDICRSVEFLLQPTHGPAGGYVLMFPLRVAQIYHDIRLPSRNYSKEQVNDINTEISMSDDYYGDESDVCIVETQSGMSVDQSAVESFSGLEEQIERVRMDSPQKENAILEAENSEATKPEQRAIVSEWIQKVMRYINDVHGFSISKSYTS
ncbi:fungal zn(2)-Cys(6) binuclear cluster domain-containing protein [Trichoderma breve]|uniref:Fungal zn(2)-Cys(6) binuclear cluster domain-containing protein n=1 Tax=Trichoderma breve TaxID=2034170 RepID=A0A9W9BJ23_9HYPO|nr:fungal zn(2)-Cys(6) binuclear cluster domain-containing protein [Trichoderma breve]KAJ4861270.1 fungal zn(2)-Cys(6) binuclear cluster domain-containing protein [Trichoderma breve]